MNGSRLYTRFVGSAHRGRSRLGGGQSGDRYRHHQSAAATGGNSFYTERTKAAVTLSALVDDQFNFRQVEPLNEQGHT